MKTRTSRRLSMSLPLLLAGVTCTSSIDAFFVNPCSEPVQITTYSSSFPSDDALGQVAVLDAEKTTKVEGAFDIPVEHGWAIEIEGLDEPLRPDEKDWVRDTIVIPAAVCNEL